jgi:acetyl esterase/lipase
MKKCSAILPLIWLCVLRVLNAQVSPTAESGASRVAPAPLPPEVRLLSDVPYLEPARKEKLDIYLPRAGAKDALRPAVVYFHGGGWTHGDKATERERNIGGHLAAAGYVFVSVNYILGPKQWPQNLLDCKNAIRFVRQHASEYGVDPERIAAMGTSAGGHLALMAAYTANQQFEPATPYPGVSNRVLAVVDFYGMSDLLTRRQVLEDGTPTDKLADSQSPAVLGAKRSEDPELWRNASPVTHVTASSPPTFIVHGLSDPTVNYGQAIELANVLRQHHVPHELMLLEGIGHMFNFDFWQATPMPAQLKPAVLTFLTKYLAPSKPSPRFP